MLIISDIIEFKNNIIQTIYTASKNKKHIITSIIKNDEDPIIQKTLITKSIEELTNSLREFTNFKEYKDNTLFHLKHIDDFISKNINETDINETNFKKIQEIRNKLILFLYENKENKAKNEEILEIAKEKNNYIKELIRNDNEINLSVDSEVTTDSTVIKQDKINSIYKPPSTLDENKYKYTSEALYCKLYDHQNYYFRISRNISYYSYSIVEFDSDEITEDKFKYITKKHYTNKKPITEDDPNRNKILGQQCIHKLKFKDALDDISYELINVRGYEQITEHFSKYEEYNVTNPKDNEKIEFVTDDYKEGILQTDTQILYKKKKDKENLIVYSEMFDGYLKSGTANIDLLELEDPYYNIIYYDNLFKINKEFKGNIQAISKELKAYSTYIQSDKDVEAVVASFINKLKKNNELKINKTYKLDGYFIHDGNFILNNKSHEEYKNLDETELKTKVKEIVKILNQYLKDLHYKFTPIFKQFLLTPFYYSFRQLKIQAPIKFIYINGKGRIGKTTTANSYNTLYYLNPTETAITTPASIKRIVQNNYNTYLIVADEFDRLTSQKYKNETIHHLKTSRFSLKVGTVSDLNDQDKTKSYHNFSYLLGTTNKETDFREGMTRVLLAYEFLESLSDTKKQYLENTYSDIDLRPLGFVFSLEMQKLYNTIGEDGFRKQFSTETKTNETINKLLTNIEKEYDIEFNKSLLEINPYRNNDNETRKFNAPNKAWTKLVNSCSKWIKNNSRIENKTAYDYMRTKLTEFKKVKIHNDTYISFTINEFKNFINYYADEVISPIEFLEEVFIEENSNEENINYITKDRKELYDNKAKVLYFDNDKQTKFNFGTADNNGQRNMRNGIILNKKGVLKMFQNI